MCIYIYIYIVPCRVSVAPPAPHGITPPWYTPEILVGSSLLSQSANSRRDGPPEAGILVSVVTLKLCNFVTCPKWRHSPGWALVSASQLLIIHLNPKQPHHPHHRGGAVQTLNPKPTTHHRTTPHHRGEGGLDDPKPTTTPRGTRGFKQPT